MKIHKTVKASHYNFEAESYDKFNEENSIIINKTIENILRENNIKTVFDLTCGTGSQVFWLNNSGYDVVGSDINSKMLKIAINKAKEKNIFIKFIKGDVRNIQAGKFDSAITIFNSIGHLTKSDFEEAIKNINTNLKNNGIYIFDIFNLDYLLYENNITKLTIDWQIINKNNKLRNIQYSTIDSEGILTSYDLHFEQINSLKTKTYKSSQTLQIYSTEELKNILEKNGFKVIKNLSVDGSEFDKFKSERILTIAKKIN